MSFKHNIALTRNHVGLHRQRGVALIFALLLVAVLAGIAASMTSRMSSQFHRATNLLNHQQAYWYSMGVEALAKVAIEETYQESDTINLSQAWAIEDARYPLDNGEAVGSIRDMQACFNLNALSTVTPLDDPSQRPPLVKVLIALLENVDVDNYQAEVIADSSWEYVDSDDRVMSQTGVESDSYQAFKPAYLAPNHFIADGSEFRAINQVDAVIYQKLRHMICAIPSAEFKLNVNTLKVEQAPLLAALFTPALSVDQAQQVIENKPYDGWSSTEDFLAESAINGLDSNSRDQASQYLTVESQYFELDAQIMVEESRVRLRSLVYSSNKQDAEIIRRRFGGISERVSDNKTD